MCIGSANTYETNYCHYINNLSYVCVHRGFHEGVTKNKDFGDDLAIITIPANMFQTVPKGISLAPLFTACYQSTCVDYEGQNGTAVGSGETENNALSPVLLEAGQRAISQSEGFAEFNHLSPSRYKLCFTRSSVAEKRMSTCAGDSGSPLCLPNPITKKKEVVGVLSFGSMSCNKDDPSAFTYLPPYIHFIKFGHECVSLATINSQTAASVQNSFTAYSINMRPRSEAIWDGMKIPKTDHNENVLKPEDELALHDVERKNEESNVTGIKLVFKVISDFFSFLAYGFR